METPQAVLPSSQRFCFGLTFALALASVHEFGQHEFGHDFVWKDRAGSIAQQRLSSVTSHRDSSNFKNMEDYGSKRSALHSAKPA